MSAEIRSTSGPVIEKKGDLVADADESFAGRCALIDEIHRLSPAVEEILYPAMEDHQVDITIGEGPASTDDKVGFTAFHASGCNNKNRITHVSAS